MPLDDDLRKADKYLLSIEAGVVREITKNYVLALKEIKVQLARMYEKYGDGVTHIDMAKYGRLQALERTISAILVELTGKNARALKNVLYHMYDESLLYTGFALERETQLKLAYTHVRREAIEAAVQNPISGLTLNQTLEKNRRDVIFRTNREITQGLILGEGYAKMARRINATMNGDAVKAIRVANTEAHRITQAARLEGIRHAAKKGVKMVKVWDATLDGKTRPAHGRLDGKKIPVDADFESSAGGRGPAPGSMGNAADDINCRCALRTEIEGYGPELRNARNAASGKSEIIPYTTYEEWKKNRIS